MGIGHKLKEQVKALEINNAKDQLLTRQMLSTISTSQGVCWNTHGWPG